MSEQIGEIYYTVRAETEGLIRGEQMATRSLDRLQSGMGRADSAAGRLATRLTPLARAIGAVVAVDSLRRMQQLAEEFVLLESRVGRLSSGAQAAALNYQRLLEIAGRTGTALGDTVRLWETLTLTLRDLGGTEAQVLRLTETLQKIGAVGGSSSQEMANALRQLGQSLAGGVVRAEEFNSILESMPQLAREIAAGLGVPFGELRQLMLDGQLTAERVLDAIQKRTAAVDAEFAKLPRTVGQAANAFTNDLGAALGVLDKAVGASQKLAGLIDAIAKGIRLTAGNLTDQERLAVLTQERAKQLDLIATLERRTLFGDSSRVKAAEKLAEINKEILAIQQRRIDEIKNENAPIVPTAGATASAPSESEVKAAQKAADAIREQVEALRMQADTLGMTETELELYKLQLAGATDEQIRAAASSRALIDAFEQQADAEKAATEAAAEAERKRKAQRDALGQADPIAGEQIRFEEQLESLRALNEAKLLEDQRYLDLKAQAERAHDEQMRVLQEENYRRQSVANELLMASLDQLQQGATNALVGLVTGANNSEEAIRGLATSILNEAVGALVQMGVQQVKNLVMGQAAAAATTAAGVAQGTALAAAYAPAAALASLASFGANAAPAQVGIATTMATTKALAVAGGRRYGGPVDAGGMYRVNENGRPEVFQGANGQQFMIPNQRGEVISNEAATGSGSPEVAVYVNVHQAPERAGMVDQRRDEGGQVIDIFVADIMGNGKAAQTLQGVYGVRRQGK